MKTLNQFPEEIQNQIMDTLTAYKSVNIDFSNGKFNVHTGISISTSYPEDFKYYGVIKNSDVYSPEQIRYNTSQL